LKRLIYVENEVGIIMAITEQDAQAILEFFDSKYRRIPFIKPSVKRFAAGIPKCMRKYTVGEVVDLLTQHYS